VKVDRITQGHIRLILTKQRYSSYLCCEEKKIKTTFEGVQLKQVETLLSWTGMSMKVALHGMEWVAV